MFLQLANWPPKDELCSALRPCAAQLLGSADGLWIRWLGRYKYPASWARAWGQGRLPEETEPAFGVPRCRCYMLFWRWNSSKFWTIFCHGQLLPSQCASQLMLFDSLIWLIDLIDWLKIWFPAIFARPPLSIGLLRPIVVCWATCTQS